MLAASSPDTTSLVVKEEPGSPAGMDLDMTLDLGLDLVPQVQDRCGVCQQPCAPDEAQGMALCLRCSSRVHARCDSRAAGALKAANVLAIKNEADNAQGDDAQQQQQQQQLVVAGQPPAAAGAGYLCPSCVHSAGDACPLDLLQLHAAVLADIKPRRPRSAADIHAAELTRKHLDAGGQLDLTLLHGLIGHAWSQEQHKARYDELADKEDAAYQASVSTYEGLYQQYASLAYSLGQAPDIALSLDPQQQLTEARTAMAAVTVMGGGGGRGGHGHGHADGGMAAAAAGGGGHVRRVRSDGSYLLGSGTTVTARDGSEVPQLINVVCNGTRGVFNLPDMKITCLCSSCEAIPPARRIFSPTQFEQHGGCGTAKKWRISIRIEPGAVPEVSRYASPMTFGRWMEMKGIEAKGQRTTAPTTGHLGTLPVHVKYEPYSGDERRGASPSSSYRAEGAGSEGNRAVSNLLPRNRRPESWAPWEDVKLGNYRAVQVRWAGDRCCVCDSDVDYDCDQLVSCEGCGVTVHQSCYGVPELPDEDDMWLCRSCELKEPGAPEPQCCLCPLTGGGLKPTTLPGLWAHAACMQWIPEVTCIEPLRMEPIDRIQHIQKERWELLCVVCRQRMGAKIQCNDCYQAFHPLCARRAGLHMEMAEPAVPNGPLQLITYCPRHCKPQPGMSGITTVNEEEHDRRIGRPRKAGSVGPLDDPNNNASGLWNAQPFKANKPPAPVPDAPGGCARASPLQDAQRISHGTGTGATTVAGFWIPTAESAHAAMVAASLGRGWGGLSGSAGLDDYDGAARTSMWGGGSRGRGRGRYGGRGRPPKVPRPPPASAGPPPEVDLMALPNGCPDRITVACNSRRGVFFVRSQRVEDGTRGGTELTPSRFEALAGKGEAKKWRSSLWAVGADGSPECQMGEWLASHKLDKHLLARLLANWSAFMVRRQWEEEMAAAAAPEEQAEGAEAADGEQEGGEGTEPAGTEGGTAADRDGEDEEDEDEVQQGAPKRQKRERSSSGGGAAAAAAAAGEDSGAGDAQQQQGAAAAADSGDTADQPAAKKQKVNGAASGDAAAAADGAQQPAADGSAAAAGGGDAGGGGGSARSTPHKTALKRVHLLHLPLGFRIHPASLPPRAAVAAAARQKQLLQQQQQAEAAAAAGAQAGAAAAAAAAAAAGLPAAADAAAAAAPAKPDPLVAAALAPKTADTAVSAVRNPWLCVGQCCRVYWPDDNEWYDADVTGYDPAARKHSLWYHADEIKEVIDLRAEEQNGRLQWLPLVDKSQWPAPPVRYYSAPPRAPPPPPQQQALVPQALPQQAPQQQVAAPQQAGPQQEQLQGSSAGPAAAAAAPGAAPTPAAPTPAAVPPAVPLPQAPQFQGPPVEPIPQGFPRLTAMHRDPSPAGGDRERADLVGLSSRGAPLSQQLQAMLLLQQQNHSRFSTQQPPRHMVPTGAAALGWRVGLFRPEVGVYYYGFVRAWDQIQHTVHFDDGLVEAFVLQKQRIDWVAEQGEPISLSAQDLHRAYLQSRGELPAAPAAAADAAGALLVPGQDPAAAPLAVPAAAPQHQHPHQQQQGLGAAAAVGEPAPPAAPVHTGPLPGAPTQVDVMCGHNTAVFDCLRMAVLTPDGTFISPTEFERASGKGCSKKWKATIRIRKANGLPGMTMGDWLLQMGYEAPRPAPVPGEGGARGRENSLNEIRRRQFSRRAAALGASPGGFGGGSSSRGDREDREYRPTAERGQSGANRGTVSHRPNCMCVICKQARRKAAQAKGVPYVEEVFAAPAAAAVAAPAPARPAAELPSAGAGARAAGGFRPSDWLIGKRAFVQAVPHVVRGAAWHQPWEVPESRCYTAEEWDAAQAAGAEDPAAAGAAAAAGSSRPGTPGPSSAAAAAGGSSMAGPSSVGPDSRASTPVLGDAPPAEAATAAAAAAADPSEAGADAAAGAAAGGEGAEPGAKAAEGGGDAVMTDAAAAAEAAAGQEGSEQQEQQGGAAAASAAPGGAAAPQQQQQQGVRGGRSTTWRSKLRVCQALEPKRITFGKSGIHGWGIFARQAIPADSMVSEFRGQLIRGILADVREASYRKQHRDCYMFHATSEAVIDNTCMGNTSRFTNHCCTPCLYVKVLELQGELHLCFFAKRDIRAGQELTFDYRFKEEDSDSKVMCQCAAPNCKGTLN